MTTERLRFLIGMMTDEQALKFLCEIFTKVELIDMLLASGYSPKIKKMTKAQICELLKLDGDKTAILSMFLKYLIYIKF